MPIDAAGNRAEIVMDAGSTISRMNLGRLYEHYIGGVARDVTVNVLKMLNISPMPLQKALRELTIVEKTQPTVIQQTYSYLMQFYSCVSPRQCQFYSELSPAEKLEHLASIVYDGIYLYYPTDNEIDTPDVVKRLEELFKPVYGPVTYTGYSGKQVTTEYPVRVAPLYIMLLEKIADDWSSISSGKLQHFGILSPMTRSEKYAYPYRNTPVKTLGETECRIIAGYCGREAVAEMLDRNNSPTTHKHIVWSILKASQPGNIQSAIDRSLVPLGSNKPNQLVSHIGMCAGWKTVYEPE